MKKGTLELKLELDATHGTSIKIYAFCHFCENSLGPFYPDDLMQPERPTCTECGKSRPIFSYMQIDTSIE